MTPPLPHPNAGHSGMLRLVIQVLEGHPEGLTTTQIMDQAAALDGPEARAAQAPKTLYFRVKRSVDSLLKLGFIQQKGHVHLDGRKQRSYALVPDAMDRALRDILRQAFGNLEDQIHNQFPMSDATRLLAAFEDVLREREDPMSRNPRRPRLGDQGFRIRKGDP